ncbi:MAG: hypothetical protein EOO43_12555 [Flavobacterium sp.]|nr:MAG: hypothetical protein EOO43_12555 [Flavobacterium sp.]
MGQNSKKIIGKALFLVTFGWLLYACQNTCDNTIKKIEIFEVQSDIPIKVISDKDTVCQFEGLIEEGKKLDLLKYSNQYNYRIICHYDNNEKKNISITAGMFVTKEGHFKSNRDIKKVLGLK